MKILGMGWPELLIILVIVAVLFAPQLVKLGPSFAKSRQTFQEGLSEEVPTRTQTAASPAVRVKTAPADSPSDATALPGTSMPASQPQAPHPAKKTNAWRIVSLIVAAGLVVALALRLTGVWA